MFLKQNKIYALLIVLFLTSCTNKYSKDNHYLTSEIGDNLYFEVYEVYSGGVFASNSYSYYVTDSLNFRTYLYTITEDSDGLDVELIDSILYVYKYTPKEKIEVNKINIEEAKREGEFD